MLKTWDLTIHSIKIIVLHKCCQVEFYSKHLGIQISNRLNINKYWLFRWKIDFSQSFAVDVNKDPLPPKKMPAFKARIQVIISKITVNFTLRTDCPGSTGWWTDWFWYIFCCKTLPTNCKKWIQMKQYWNFSLWFNIPKIRSTKSGKY